MTKIQQQPLYLRADEIHGRIVGKYPPPAWVVLGEVRDGTGYGSSRSADTLAFGVWPSRGLQVIGFEIKVNRNDWLRELKDPVKAESIAQHCDQWFLVTCDGVAKLEEIPAAWGWYVATAKGLRLEKAPAEMAPKEIGRSFLMSIIRNISRNYVAGSEVREKVKAEATAMAKMRRDENAYRLEQLGQLEKRVAQFKEASGIDLDNEYKFPAKETGEIVKAVLEWRLDHHVANIADAAKKAQEVLATIQELPAFRNMAARRLSKS